LFYLIEEYDSVSKDEIILDLDSETKFNNSTKLKSFDETYEGIYEDSYNPLKKHFKGNHDELGNEERISIDLNTSK